MSTLSWWQRNDHYFEQGYIRLPGSAHLPLLEAVNQLAQAEFKFINTPPIDDQERFLNDTEGFFRASLLWVIYYQILGKKLRIKGFIEAFPGIESAKTHGRFYSDLLNLAEAVLAFQDEWGGDILPYQNALEWWQLCMVELLGTFWADSQEYEAKDTLLKRMRSEYKSLEEFNWPEHWDDQRREKYPNLTRLFVAALEIAPHRPKDAPKLRAARKRFRDIDWGAYLLGHKGLIRFRGELGLQSLFFQGGNLYIPMPNGGKGTPKAKRLFPAKGFKSGRGIKP